MSNESEYWKANSETYTSYPRVVNPTIRNACENIKFPLLGREDEAKYPLPNIGETDKRDAKSNNPSST